MITLALAAGLLAAHPLGNFTVNHYDGLVAAPHELRIDHVEDLAEIPAAQTLPELDTDRDGRPSAAELRAWADGACRKAAASMRVTVDGRAATASVRSASGTAPRARPGCRRCGPSAGSPHRPCPGRSPSARPIRAAASAGGRSPRGATG